jgi:hypothetical protein
MAIFIVIINNVTRIMFLGTFPFLVFIETNGRPKSRKEIEKSY